MGDWTDQSVLLDEIKYSYSELYDNIISARYWYDISYANFLFVDQIYDAGWVMELFKGINNVIKALEGLNLINTDYEDDIFGVPYYLGHYCGGADMDSILSAMLGANSNQFTKFIGIVDAYRVALWEAPFNAEFYAALARGFKYW